MKELNPARFVLNGMIDSSKRDAVLAIVAFELFKQAAIELMRPLFKEILVKYAIRRRLRWSLNRQRNMARLKRYRDGRV